jgi:hypothetical protein
MTKSLLLLIPSPPVPLVDSLAQLPTPNRVAAHASPGPTRTLPAPPCPFTSYLFLRCHPDPYVRADRNPIRP